MLDIVSRRKWFYIFSLAITVPGLVFLLLGGLKPGIDFTGGTIWELQFRQPVQSLAIKEVLDANGYPEAQVQIAEGDVALIRTRELKEGLSQKRQEPRGGEAERLRAVCNFQRRKRVDVEAGQSCFHGAT